MLRMSVISVDAHTSRDSSLGARYINSVLLPVFFHENKRTEISMITNAKSFESSQNNGVAMRCAGTRKRKM